MVFDIDAATACIELSTTQGCMYCEQIFLLVTILILYAGVHNINSVVKSITADFAVVNSLFFFKWKSSSFIYMYMTSGKIQQL